MLKILIAQINTSVGDFNKNFEKISDCIRQGHENKSDLIVFPECTTTGYPQKDLLYDGAFIDENLRVQKEIQRLTERYKNITVVLGCVSRIGSSLFNSAVVFRNGINEGFYNKKLLPNYNVFDERRYFEQGSIAPVFSIRNTTFGITICEDLWDASYEQKPIKQYLGRVNLIINLSASPFATEKIEKRKKILSDASNKIHVPILYVNQVGAQDSLIFDGSSMIASGNSVIIVSEQFKESLDEVTFLNHNWGCWKGVTEYNEIEKIRQALVLGIKDYFQKNNFFQTLLGLSGGIDSAVVCSLAVEALGSENVLGVLMPSQYSSQGSIDDAKELAEALKIKTQLIPIKEILYQFNNELLSLTDTYKSDVTEQNLQARIRGNLLMAISNDEGRLLLSTGNKSEMSVGYCTIYGDMAGGLSVISDVYKTTVYKLAEILPGIPRNSITKPPSAELKPDQKDTDSLPPYEILDGILKQYIERKKSYQEILDKGFDPDIVKKVIRMVDRNEYKRRQAAPGLIISDRDLVVGRRMPIANKFNFVP
jgi:NAD+ synthase (glutamine-hydrolysing)